ncbi:hypothetical protein HNP84_009420 [Thermocatellispora tengchongensis]|uniref:DUF2178 domain-containing protein n=2 Tax=Thermocatellispora tengchongensis TaxID=1073253 RepID=A0A840PL62_9ACTN|nr:hypothetical protein [Thermocatellispora tengchongensis]MBB5139656.1 hypothetical protein [Thermocatellispora tengchongensis]
MSFQEKRAWVYAVIGLCVPVVYFAVIFVRAGGGDVTRTAYVVPMLVAIGGAVVLNIAAEVVAGIAAGREAGLKDERDRQIGRLGEYVGFYVMSVLALVPLGLAMGEAAHFWIAHTLYLAFVLAALASAVTKIVAYRRGL